MFKFTASADQLNVILHEIVIGGPGLIDHSMLILDGGPCGDFINITVVYYP